MADSSIRLLQVIAGAEHGGAEKFFNRLAVAFSKREIDQCIIMRPFQEASELFIKHKIPFLPAPFRRILDFDSMRIIKKAIHDFQPQLILTWMSRASQMVPKLNIPVIARLGGYYDLKYYRKADYLVGNTRDIVQYFIKNGWPIERTRYLPNFPDLPHSSARINRAEFETPENVPLLLSLGRFHIDKAFDILIKVLAQVPEAYLWLGGIGPEENSLKSLARQLNVLDRIRFIGWHSDTSPLYQACDIYVCPSRIEPLGNVVLEAWVHQKPTVAARSAGPAGLITHSEDGLLVDIEDVDGLANALQCLIHDKNLRNQIAINGFNTFQNNFTEKTVVDAYLQFFNKVINSHMEKR